MTAEERISRKNSQQQELEGPGDCLKNLFRFTARVQNLEFGNSTWRSVFRRPFKVKNMTSQLKRKLLNFPKVVSFFVSGQTLKRKPLLSKGAFANSCNVKSVSQDKLQLRILILIENTALFFPKVFSYFFASE